MFTLGGLLVLSFVLFCIAYLFGNTYKPDNIAIIGNTNSINKVAENRSSPQIEAYIEVETRDKIQNPKSYADQTDCLIECKNALLDSLLSKDNLSPDDINLISSNIEYFVRYIRYNPEIVAKSGAFLSGANVGDEGGEDYNEDLDNKVMLVDDILSHLSVDDLQLAANSTINSQDITSRQAGLVFIEAAYLTIDDSKEDDADSLQIKAELAATLNSFLYLETDPKMQLSAIEMMTKNSPDIISEQVTGILSSLSKHDPDPNVRGQAIELAALSAQPDSFVLTQIADELAQPSSAVHASALKALALVHMRTSKDDTAMLERLKEFEAYLNDFVDNAELGSETANHAAGLIKDFHTE